MNFAQARAERAMELEKRYGPREVNKEKNIHESPVHDKPAPARAMDGIPGESMKKVSNLASTVGEVGQKPVSWGLSLVERERVQEEEKEKIRNVSRTGIEKNTSQKHQMLEEPIVPPHLTGTRKADRRRNVPLSRKRSLGKNDEALPWEAQQKKQKYMVDWTTDETLKASSKT